MRYKILAWVKQGNETSEFTEHYDRLDAKGQARCDERLRYLRDQPPHMWKDPHAKKLSWENDKLCQGIYEIRFEAGRVQQRPMGYFGQGSDEFSIMVWATHKGSQYKPSNFCELAKRRFECVCENKCRTEEIEID
ncbi:type II toxin-antitoxin system RelE/ParE family toxin [Pandoraea pnomenusa]|uniref:type II toxin-antitoxin system RelE/ParE family toxin n=1 Tax=Pandoraea pnomenusa TaxID=93220 RepID=UPI0033420C41